MSPSQHMGLPILCTPPRVSVDPGNTILMSWNSASNQLTILHFMIKDYRWNSRVCLIVHFSTCSSRRSSQSFWFATTWTSLFGPLRPITHCPQKSPFTFIPVLLPSDCQVSLAFFLSCPSFRETEQRTAALILPQLNWKLRSQSWWLIGQLPPWPIAFLTQQGVVVEVMSAKLTTIKHLML